MSGGQPQGKPGGKGDPILTGFDLRPFEFMGQPGSTYNLISEQRHQVRVRSSAEQPLQHESTCNTLITWVCPATCMILPESTGAQ